jgi:hypothetical protein
MVFTHLSGCFCAALTWVNHPPQVRAARLPSWRYLDAAAAIPLNGG